MASVLLQPLNPTEGYVRDSTPTTNSRCCSRDHVFVSQQQLRCDAHTYPSSYVAHRDTQTHANPQVALYKCRKCDKMRRWIEADKAQEPKIKSGCCAYMVKSHFTTLNSARDDRGL